MLSADMTLEAEDEADMTFKEAEMVDGGGIDGDGCGRPDDDRC